jgi:putative transposase
MPWKGVTVTEQRQRFLEDYQLNYYSITELAERFYISRKTAYKWIKRFKQDGSNGFHELSRMPQSCPCQADKGIVEELVDGRTTKDNSSLQCEPLASHPDKYPLTSDQLTP